MRRFAELIDALAREPEARFKARLLGRYFHATPDSDRGVALAIMRGAIATPRVRPALLRPLFAGRVDDALYDLSLAFVGDAIETMALIWPGASERGHNNPPGPSLPSIVNALIAAGKSGLPAVLPELLDEMDEAGRFVLLKLATGGLRIAASPSDLRAAFAALGDTPIEDIEESWSYIAPPYAEFFAWISGAGPRPTARHACRFQAPMIARETTVALLADLDPRDFQAEWLWSETRAQAVISTTGLGSREARLFSRRGDDISGQYPGIIAALREWETGDAIIDAHITSPSTQSKRDAIAQHLMLHDVLILNGDDLRALPLSARRARLESIVGQQEKPGFPVSPVIPFKTFAELNERRNHPPPGAAGLMLKRRDSAYARGDSHGAWRQWRRDRFSIDGVLMYGQGGGAGVEATLGVWRDDQLVPVARTTIGPDFNDYARLEKWIRDNTLNRFGPVREVVHGAEDGLVLSFEFSAIDKAPRRKAGLILRAPVVTAVRWDARAGEAARIEHIGALSGDQPP